MCLAGREWWIDPATKFKDQSIPEADLELLDNVFTAIGDLLEEPGFQHFTWIGSGLQKHYGHLTVAHQDAFGSVKERYVKAMYVNQYTESSNLYAAIFSDEKIHEIIKRIDPSGQSLSVKETVSDSMHTAYCNTSSVKKLVL